MELRLPELEVLDDVERSCLSRYLALLVETIGEELVEVVLFGSVARNERWPRGMPIRSDLDLLVVTDASLPEHTTTALVDATLPLFLESGRQIGPQFRTRRQLEHPRDRRNASFLESVRREGVGLYRRG